MSESLLTTHPTLEAPRVPGRFAKNRFLRRGVVIGGLVLLFFVPQILGGSLRVYDTLVVICIYSLMVYGVDILLSYLGDISLGHTAFWAAGAYVTAVFSVKYGWNSWLTLLASILTALMLAGVLGVAVYKARAFIFTLSTYAIAVVLSNVAHNWAFVGGSDGLVGIPFLDLSVGPLDLSTRTIAEMWPYAFGALALVVLAISRFRHSKLAKTALMAYMNPDLATTMGVNVSRVRFQLLVVSAVPPAIAGWLYAYYRAYVGTDLFDMYFLILMLTAAAIVGRRVLLGPVLGTALIIAQQNFASFGSQIDKLLLGSVLVIVLVFLPSGLVGIWHYIKRGIAAAAARRTMPRD